MQSEKITVRALVKANKQKVWNYYTQAQHIVNWNFADPSWHCPDASNDLRVGGLYRARMEAKDASFGFDFEAIYTMVNPGEGFSYQFGDRYATVELKGIDGHTEITVVFDPETENPHELQQKGWQSILDNFARYTESH